MSNNPQTDDRRDRYATALAQITVGHRAFIKVDVQAEYRRAEAVMAVADAEQTAARADVLREVADICDEAGANYTAKALNDHAAGAYELMERFQRKVNEAEYVATPCSVGGCEPGGEPCSTHERLMAHGEGDHELCAPDCGEHPAVLPAVPVPPAPDPDLRALVDAYLTATHTAAHDSLGEGGTCYGCALRDWMRRTADGNGTAAVLPPTTAPDLAALAEDLRYVLNSPEPRHDHQQPGVWDTSGEPCEHCARVTAAREHLAAFETGVASKGAPKADSNTVDRAADRTYAEAVQYWYDAATERRTERDRLRAVVARVAQMADAWEQRLPEVIRTPAVVSAIRAALEAADDPSRMADEVQQPAECSPACSEQHTYSPGCALAADEAQQQCPGVETVPNRCTCPCEGCKHHCGAHNPDETQQQADTETPTEEQIVRDHVTSLHLIGEQLADIENWMWRHLADVRDASGPDRVAGEEPAETDPRPCGDQLTEWTCTLPEGPHPEWHHVDEVNGKWWDQMGEEPFTNRDRISSETPTTCPGGAS